MTGTITDDKTRRLGKMLEDARRVAVGTGMADGRDNAGSVDARAQLKGLFSKIHDANLTIILHFINHFYNFVRHLIIIKTQK